MPEPSLSNARHDPLLTNFLVEFANAPSSYVFANVFGVVPVALPAGVYKAVKQGELFKDRVRERPMGMPPHNVGFEFEDKSYAVIEEGLETTIDARERANFNLGGSLLERIKTKQLMEEIMIHLDRKWADAYFKTGVWTVDEDGSDLVQAWDASNSEPPKDIRRQLRAMQKKTGKKANRLVLGSDIFDSLLNHSDLISRVSGGSTTGSPAIADIALMQRYFFPDDATARVLVAEAIVNTADSGQAMTGAMTVTANAMLLTYTEPVPAIGVATAGATFAWTGRQANAFPTPGITPNVFRGTFDRGHSDWFQVLIDADFGVVAADLGTFTATVVTAS